MLFCPGSSATETLELRVFQFPNQSALIAIQIDGKLTLSSANNSGANVRRCRIGNNLQQSRNREEKP
jgi:hypothetical protein